MVLWALAKCFRESHDHRTSRYWICGVTQDYVLFLFLKKKVILVLVAAKSSASPGNIPRPNQDWPCSRASSPPPPQPEDTKILHCCFLSTTIPFIERMPGIMLKQLLLLITAVNGQFLHGPLLRGNVLILKSAWVLLNHLWRPSCFLLP